MTEPVKITITPSVADSDRLTVQDAAHQLLDLFDLLKLIDKKKGGTPDEQLEWCLTNVSMNSPLNAEVSGCSKDPTVLPDMRVLQVTGEFSRGMKAIIEGQSYDAWPDDDEMKFYTSILKRTTNGIGKTDISFGDDRPAIVLSHRIAKEGLLRVEKRKIDIEASKEDFTHQAHGSVEGVIVSTQMYYNKPSVMIKERISGENIHCVMDQALSDTIGEEHNWSEVWQSKRVLVEGLISYDAAGRPKRVNASNITLVKTKKISLADIYDEDFTNGLPVGEYQEKIREGKLDDN